MDTNTLSICTGYGGIELGLREVVEGIRTVCYVENEVAVCEILAQRIEEGFLDDAPIWTDLRTFDATAWRGKIHLLTGGFPCQPHSVAGKQKGADDPRELSGEVLRIADELGRPTLFLENVPRIKQFWWDNVRPRLQDMGYRVEECLVTAEETGAPHRRERMFMLCHQLASELPDPELKRAQVSLKGRHSGKQDTGDHGTEIIPLFPPGPSNTRGWEYVYSELPALIPSFCRVVDGNTPWVDPQLRAIGNGVVPAVAALAWRILSKRFIKED